MEYKKLISVSTDNDFEDVRHHIINYILRQGNALIRSDLQEGRSRPDWKDEEYGSVASQNCLYFFKIDPFVSGKVRKLEIVLCGDNKDILLEKKIILTKGNQLREEIN